MTPKKLCDPAYLWSIGYTEQDISAYADKCKKFVKDLRAHSGKHTGPAPEPKKKNKKASTKTEA